jgi:hypothetical protein
VSPALASKRKNIISSPTPDPTDSPKDTTPYMIRKFFMNDSNRPHSPLGSPLTKPKKIMINNQTEELKEWF